MIRSKWRVLCPVGDSSVLPCIGSHCHTTRCPDRVTASTIGGSRSRTLSEPIRDTIVTRPSTRRGSSVWTSSTAMSGVVVGPIFTPIGFASSAANPTCAPSSCRVRSPIHTWCADSRYSWSSFSRSSARS